MSESHGWAGRGRRRWPQPRSPRLSRSAGPAPKGVVQSFFDELFNHLDPYSRYVPPTRRGEDRERRVGQAGVGLRLGAARRDHRGGRGRRRPGALRRHSRRRCDPVGRRPVGARQDPAAVARWIAGPEGTHVIIDLARRATAACARPELTAHVGAARDRVRPARRRRAGDPGHRRSTTATDTQLSRARSRTGFAGPRPPEGIVLDLRGNRGGLLRQAVTAADTLLPAGVVATPPAATRRRPASGAPKPANWPESVPVVVMVDGRTASAAGDPGRGTGRSRPRRGGRQLHAGQGAGADHRSAAGRRRAVRHLEPRAGAARLADPGPRAYCRRSAPASARGAAAAARRAGAGRAADGSRRSPRTVPHAHRCRRRRSWRCAAPVRRPRAASATSEAARVLLENPAAYAAALLPPMTPSGQSVGLSEGR